MVPYHHKIIHIKDHDHTHASFFKKVVLPFSFSHYNFLNPFAHVEKFDFSFPGRKIAT